MGGTKNKIPTLQFYIDPKVQPQVQFFNNIHPTTLGCLQISGLIDPKQHLGTLPCSLSRATLHSLFTLKPASAFLTFYLHFVKVI